MGIGRDERRRTKRLERDFQTAVDYYQRGRIDQAKNLLLKIQNDLEDNASVFHLRPYSLT